MNTRALIDRTLYMVVPRTTVRRTYVLGKMLRKQTPEQTSADVMVMAARLDDTLESSAKAIRVRYREYGPSIFAAEAEVDAFADLLEKIRRTRVEQVVSLDCPLVRRLAAEPVVEGGFDYADLLRDAQVAGRIQSLLYVDAVDYYRMSYEEQSVHMQTLSALIEEEGCGDALDQLIGAKIGAALRDAHRRYDAMIEARHARKIGSDVDLRAINFELRRAILNYVIPLLGTIRDEDDANVETIRRALRPIDALRQQLLVTRTRNGGQPVEPSDPEAIEELVAEQQAVDAELGLEPEETDEPPVSE